jgi:hypothetical protein
MTLWEQIVNIYPELTDNDFLPNTGCINLQDDSDGLGAFIAKWEYSQPLPEGLKVGK